jgi:hypothetical protein
MDFKFSKEIGIEFGLHIHALVLLLSKIRDRSFKRKPTQDLWISNSLKKLALSLGIVGGFTRIGNTGNQTN